MSATRHYCAAVTCPGYAYKASEIAHPCPNGETTETIRDAYRKAIRRAEEAEARESALRESLRILRGDLGRQGRQLANLDDENASLRARVSSRADLERLASEVIEFCEMEVCEDSDVMHLRQSAERALGGGS